jgi:lipid-binding SYLF domain-containing protein
MKRSLYRSSLAGLLILAAAGCSTAPKSTADRTDLQSQADHTLAMAQSNDPTLKMFIQNSAGYAVFPTVGKGGLIIGGAYGKGVLYEAGRPVAFCDLTQGAVGALIGGQSYSEILCFQTPKALADFKSGDFALSAGANAVALRAGAAADAKYSNAVAIFTMDQAGLMAEASIGGQKFNVAPLMAEPVPAGAKLEP